MFSSLFHNSNAFYFINLYLESKIFTNIYDHFIITFIRMILISTMTVNKKNFRKNCLLNFMMYENFKVVVFAIIQCRFHWIFDH